VAPTIIQIAKGTLLDVNGIEINDKTDSPSGARPGISNVVIHATDRGYPSTARFYRSTSSP
jgi:hypothetical protein